MVVPFEARGTQNRRPFEIDVFLRRWTTCQTGCEPDSPQDKSMPSVKSRNDEWSCAQVGARVHPVLPSLTVWRMPQVAALSNVPVR